MKANVCIDIAANAYLKVLSLEAAYILVRTNKNTLWRDYSECEEEMNELNNSFKHYGFFGEDGRIKPYTLEEARAIIAKVDATDAVMV